MAIDLMKSNSEPVHKNYSWIIIIVAVLACFSASAIFLVKGLNDYDQMTNMQLTWRQIQELADTPSDDAPDEYIDGEGHVITIADFSDDPLYRAINLQALIDVNADVSGYIYIPDTNINYPILRETLPNQYYYMDHNINKEYDKYGSIFEICDYERGIPNQDTAVNVIFGHHMASGAMFTDLYKFYREETRDEFLNKPIYIYRDNYRIEYRPSALLIIDKNDPVYDFDGYVRGSEAYAQLLQRFANETQVNYPMNLPTSMDDTLILSTCYGQAGTSQRLILVCTAYRVARVPEIYNQTDNIPTPTDALPANEEE